jgi:hypothetical protein
MEIKRTKNSTTGEYFLILEAGDGRAIRITADPKRMENPKQKRDAAYAQFEPLKYFTALDLLKKTNKPRIWTKFIYEHREDYVSTWQRGLPPDLKKVGTPEFLNKKTSNESKGTRNPKDNPPWTMEPWATKEVIEARKTKDKKANEEYKAHKYWEDNGMKGKEPTKGSGFDLYSDEIFDGFAKAKIKFYNAHPDWEAKSYEKDSSLAEFLFMPSVWTWYRKIKSDLRAAEGMPWKQEEVERKRKAWLGLLGKIKSRAKQALEDNQGDPKLPGENKKDDFFPPEGEEYTVSSEEEQFNKVVKEIAQEDYSTAVKLLHQQKPGLSRKQIDAIINGLLIEDRDFSKANRNTPEEVTTFGDIIKGKKTKF